MRFDKLKPFILTALILAIISIYPSTITAQTVAVTGTITDTQTTPYSNGLLTVTFVNATGQLATFGGNPSFQKSYAIYLDSNGAFTISLPPNSTASPSIQPAGTQWNFSYQSQGGYGAANINVTITGAGSISGTLSNLARITWPYGNIPPPGAAGQGIVFVSSTSLGWGSTGSGSVTHTAGNLTLNSMMLGNGVADAKVDSACVTNGSGALSGCTSISTTGSLSTGSGASAAGATATGGFACVEGASTGWTPTAGQDYERCDSTLHNFAISVNGAAETPKPVFSAVPAGSKCLQSSGVAGLIAEAAAACGGAGALVQVPATTAANTVAPTTDIVGMTVLQTTAGAPASDVFDVCTNSAGACGTKLLKVIAGGATQVSGAFSMGGAFIGLDTNGFTNYINANDTASRTHQLTDASGTLETTLCENVTPVTLPGTSTTADQNLMACTINAKALNLASRAIRVTAKDLYTTAAGNLSTITRKLLLCSVSGCASGNITTLISIVSSAQVGTITNDPIMVHCIATTQTAGAASRFEASGDLIIDLSAATTAAESIFLDTNTATKAGSPADIDTNAQMFLQSTISFSIANAGNVATERQLTVEIIN